MSEPVPVPVSNVNWWFDVARELSVSIASISRYLYQYPLNYIQRSALFKVHVLDRMGHHGQRM